MAPVTSNLSFTTSDLPNRIYMKHHSFSHIPYDIIKMKKQLKKDQKREEKEHENVSLETQLMKIKPLQIVRHIEMPVKKETQTKQNHNVPCLSSVIKKADEYFIYILCTLTFVLGFLELLRL